MIRPLQRLRIADRLERTGLLLLLLATFCFAWATPAQTEDDFESFGELDSFEDAPLAEPISLPAWFKLSFLDLSEDLDEAIGDGKTGLMVYLGQKYCAYCKKLLHDNFDKLDILAYTQKHFDAIGIDIHGQRVVTNLQGMEWTERSFAVEQGVDFTPTLIFYDKDKREALRLTGYYPPYKFRAALEYVAAGYYLKEDFRTYLARADVPLVFDAGDMNYQDFFPPPPHALDRSRWPGQRPLAVFFEQANCHACDVLHTGPLDEADIRQRIKQLDLTQLDIWSDTPVITPAGERTTARQWADRLGLFYTPTLIFFDERGDEILRVDSVVQFYRLRNVLDYILSGAYRQYPTFQQWRSAQGR
ncbi:MAG: thioredoxin fold domain-containing protein [Thiogranum sp.]